MRKTSLILKGSAERWPLKPAPSLPMIIKYLDSNHTALCIESKESLIQPLTIRLQFTDADKWSSI